MNIKIVFDSVDIIDGIKDSFSVHVSMEEDVFSARVVNLEPSPEMLNGKADAIINTASGEIASFPDGADGVPMKSLVVSMQPIQSLHGYSHPWPAGGGVNKFDEEMVLGILNNDGTVSSSTTRLVSKNFIPITAETQYSMSWDKPGSSTARARGAFYDSTETFLSYVGDLGSTPTEENGRLVTQFTTPQNAAYLKICMYTSYGTTYKNDITIGLYNASTNGKYYPYSNLCPISGRTGLNVYRTGKNLFNKNATDQNAAHALSPSTASEYSAGSYTVTGFIKVKEGVKYITSGTGGSNDVCFYDESKARLSGSANFNGARTAPTGAVWLKFDYKTANADTVQLEEGSTATAYESFGNTYAVDWTSEAGTVYGGTVDVVTGVLTVDRANIASYNGETINEPWLSSMDAYAAGTTPTIGAQVVYPLATPLTYQLTPQEVETLKGQNHVWSDAGDVDLTYVADTKLYIDNKIAQAIAAALNA